MKLVERELSPDRIGNGTWRDQSIGRRSLADFASMSFRGDSLQQTLGTKPAFED